MTDTAEAEPFDQPAEQEDSARSKASATMKALGEKASELCGSTKEKAFDFASQGKDKASDALNRVAKFADDNVSTVEDKLGANAADYVRKASDAVTGFASSLRSKEMDELLNDAKQAVRKNPAVAIGAAVAVGFVVARLIKTGIDNKA